MSETRTRPSVDVPVLNIVYSDPVLDIVYSNPVLDIAHSDPVLDIQTVSSRLVWTWAFLLCNEGRETKPILVRDPPGPLTRPTRGASSTCGTRGARSTCETCRTCLAPRCSLYVSFLSTSLCSGK